MRIESLVSVLAGDPKSNALRAVRMVHRIHIMIIVNRTLTKTKFISMLIPKMHHYPNKSVTKLL